MHRYDYRWNEPGLGLEGLGQIVWLAQKGPGSAKPEPRLFTSSASFFSGLKGGSVLIRRKNWLYMFKLGSKQARLDASFAKARARLKLDNCRLVPPLGLMD